MGDSLRLGRIAGIEIGINWSWLVVFGLITWSLSEAVFPNQNPGLSHGTYIAMAIVASLLFFGSLLLHELGHALVARREGMEIEGITLWLFGGVAKFRGIFPSAGAEFRIAAAGPLVSLVLGVLFALAAWQLTLPTAVDGVAAWLGYINLVLLAFNLLPALPLDGGRIFRAILWQVRGDFAWATRVAGTVGRGFGYLLIAGGIAMTIFQGAFTGIWLAFVGWFLLQAAGSELRFLAARQALVGLRVGDLMVRDPETVTADLTLAEFMNHVMWSRRHTTYPVVKDGRVVGLLPFQRTAEAPRDEWHLRQVRDYMLSLDQVPVLHEDDDAIEALQELSDGNVQRGIVLDGGDRLAGLVSVSDLARALEAGGGRRRGRAERPLGV
jgi:Zn-dependent protease